MRLYTVYGGQMVTTPGVAGEVFPEGRQTTLVLGVKEIKCREKGVQFRSIWSVASFLSFFPAVSLDLAMNIERMKACI